MSIDKIAPVAEPAAHAGDWPQWFARLDGLVGLKDGWNGYAAPAPGPRALAVARTFLAVMQQADFPPTRLAPSAMGGVGVTRRQAGRKVYVEFYNDGTAHALFSSGLDGMDTRPVPADQAGMRSFLAEMRDYLNG